MVDVAQWLADLGLSQYSDAFEEHAIDGDILEKLNDDDLKELGVKALGHRKRLLEAIAAFSATNAAYSSSKRAETQPARDAERRQLTLLFCDLVGSTELSGQLDPEELAEVMRSYQKTCQTQIERWGGHTAKFLGDGVLAYFGFPEAHENDAERAVRAGLDLVREVAALTAGDRRLSARVGIATGLVIVGELIGEGASLEEAVIGETPNLAARLQALAEPGCVAISALTRNLVGELFDIEDLGAHSLKGFARPIEVWGVASARPGISRFAARAGRGLAPLIGRERELALFHDLWRQTRSSQGQMLLIAGEPGIGKSRLTQAMVQGLAEQDTTTVTFQCSPFHQNSALHPLIERIEQAAIWHPDDRDDTRLDKIESLFSQALPDEDDAPALIAALLSLPTKRYPNLNLTAQRQKERTLATLASYLESFARGQPALLIFEDVHWIDPTSLELLDQLADRLKSLAMIVILTYRPEFQPTWLGQAHIHSVMLNRLPKSQSAQMVKGVVDGKALPIVILEQIVEKTDGVPLFLEELTKTVIEAGFLTDAGDHFTIEGDLPPLAIPTSLRDSLAARLDRFSHVKEVAQIGAAIGREFSHDLIASLWSSDEEQLTASLDSLLEAGLIFKRGAGLDGIYIFKHALVQDAAYQSMLIARRQQLHAKIARTLIERLNDTAEHQPEVIAHHFSEAGLYDQAAVYWRQAGELALRRSAMAEAIAHLRRGIDDLRKSAAEESKAKNELELQLALGAALIASKGYAAPETGETYERTVELCDLAGTADKLAPALYGLSLFHMDSGRLRKSAEVAESLLKRADGSAAKVLGHRVAGTALMHMGEWQEAHDHHKMALELYEPAKHQDLRHLYAQDQRVSAMAHISWPLLLLGYVDEAQSYRDRALTEARDIQHPHSLAFALHSTYLVDVRLQDTKRLMTFGKDMLVLCDEHGFAFHRCGGHSSIGSALFLEGHYQDAIENFLKSLDGYRSTDAAYLIHVVLGQLSRCHLALGQIDDSVAFLEQAFDAVNGNEERSDEPPLWLLKGQIALRQGQDIEVAVADIRRGLDLARRQKALWWELHLTTFLAHLHVDLGERDEARAMLQPIYDRFTSGFETRDLLDAKALLDSFY